MPGEPVSPPSPAPSGVSSSGPSLELDPPIRGTPLMYLWGEGIAETQSKRAAGELARACSTGGGPSWARTCERMEISGRLTCPRCIRTSAPASTRPGGSSVRRSPRGPASDRRSPALPWAAACNQSQGPVNRAAAEVKQLWGGRRV